MTTVVAEHPPKLLSIDEFMAIPDSAGYELIEGVLVERKTKGALSGHVAIRVARVLSNFCDERGVGYVFGSETTYRCFDVPDTGRRADVSFISVGRLPGEQIPESYITIPADLVVEVVSPNDLAYEVADRVALYLQYGFSEVWVIYPNTRTAHVHRRGQPILPVEGNQEIKGSGALTGFACDVSQFFPRR